MSATLYLLRSRLGERSDGEFALVEGPAGVDFRRLWQAYDECRCKAFDRSAEDIRAAGLPYATGYRDDVWKQRNACHVRRLREAFPGVPEECLEDDFNCFVATLREHGVRPIEVLDVALDEG